MRLAGRRDHALCRDGRSPVRFGALRATISRAARTGPRGGRARRFNRWPLHPFSFPNLVLGVVALFLYVGVEVMAGDTIGIYGSSIGMPLSATKHLTSYTLIAMVVGYVVGIVSIPKFISARAKRWPHQPCWALVLTVAATQLSGYSSVLCIALLGFANALGVAGHLALGHCNGFGPTHQNRQRPAHHGYRRWGDTAAALRQTRGITRHRPPAGILDDGALLLVHPLVRMEGAIGGRAWGAESLWLKALQLQALSFKLTQNSPKAIGSPLPRYFGQRIFPCLPTENPACDVFFCSCCCFFPFWPMPRPPCSAALCAMMRTGLFPM
jgi:hypothetical protein